MSGLLPAGFYPLLRLAEDKQLDDVGLHTQALFCEHVTLSLVFDGNPSLAGTTGLISWTHPRAQASMDYLHTMGLAEMNMIGLLPGHTTITGFAKGGRTNACAVYGHRHVMDMIALPEFIQHLKPILGNRFGIFVASRSFLIAFRLDSDQPLKAWYDVALKHLADFRAPLPFVMDRKFLSSLPADQIPDLADFVLGASPKEIGTGSIRPAGAAEVILGEGLQAHSREEQEQAFIATMTAMQRAATQAAEHTKKQVFDYAQAISLDAEDLAEMGMTKAYDLVAEEARKRYGILFDDLSERIEDETASYFVTFQGREHPIDSWEKAAMVLFEVVNRQIQHLPVRFYALNGGNDLHGIFLTPAVYEQARSDHERTQEWPYLPDLNGIHFPGDG